MSTKDKIKKAAIHLFAERGVDVVTVRDIADAVGMTAPNLYAHYRSRDALVSELFLEGYADYGARVAAALKARAPLGKRIDNLVELVASLHDNDHDRFRFLLMTQHQNLSLIDQDAAVNPIQSIFRFIADVRGKPLDDEGVFHDCSMIIGYVLQTATGLLYARRDGKMLPLVPEMQRRIHAILKI